MDDSFYFDKFLQRTVIVPPDKIIACIQKQLLHVDADSILPRGLLLCLFPHYQVLDVLHEYSEHEPSITESIEEVDVRLLVDAEKESFDDGATALLIITTGGGRSMQVVQIGDAQAVRCGPFGAEALCSQHRSDNDEELKRLESVGAVVDDFGRVQGRRQSLAVTRSLGDLDLKQVSGRKTSTRARARASSAPEPSRSTLVRRRMHPRE